ncbi:hypothetical protein JCM8547_002203 [Rhodosporidiobolus lusitaniae]
MPPSPPRPPQLARLKSDDAGWPRLKRSHSQEGQLGTPSCALSTAIPSASPSSSAAVQAPSQGKGGYGTSTSSGARRIGALGIPIDDDEDDQQELSGSSLGSLRPYPPASAGAPHLDMPDGTLSRVGSTRSGPSTRAGETAEGTTTLVSEESFRDIVDDLTRQNQQLKARLKRFESARVPNELRKERLFEIRWHEGLPKTRRREIEAFLSGYVQSLSSSASGEASSSSHPLAAADDRTLSLDFSETTSSLGATMRSLRSSEKDAARKDAQGLTRSTSRSGGGSKSSGSKPNQQPAPELSTSAHPYDPPALLRRPTDVFPPDRDFLAAPSFSGVEPVSLTGTGAGMRISDPSAKRRKRKRTSDLPANAVLERPSPLRWPPSYEGTLVGEEHISDPERLESLIVEMVERLFFESLPVEGVPAESSSTPNPLHSEPYPLPAQSSTNTHYLRQLLDSPETKERGGWIYLNLISTFASLHRLNVTVGLVRHALRSRSKLLEVSDEGSKLRWLGPQMKSARKAGEDQEEFSMCGLEGNDVEATQMQPGQAEAGVAVKGGRRESRSTSGSGSNSRSGGGGTGSGGTSRLATSKTGVSTVPTSLHPSNDKAQERDNSNEAGERRLTRSRISGEEGAASTTVEDGTANSQRLPDESVPPSPSRATSAPDPLGSSALPTMPKHLYTPLIFQSAPSPSDDGQSQGDADSDAASDGDAGERPSKRLKSFEGGVVFFSNELFFSDLAGDSSELVRHLQADQAGEAFPPRSVLGDSSCLTGETGATSSVSRSNADPSEAARANSASIASSAAAEDDAGDRDVAMLDTMPAWDKLEELALHGVAPSREEEEDDYHVFSALPLSTLQLSATSDASASDHFTVHVKRRLPLPVHSPSSPYSVSLRKPSPLSQPVYLSFHTMHHHPSICPRFPRVRMRISSTSSDSEDELASTCPPSGSLSPTSSQLRRSEQLLHGGISGGGDYLMSLALPLNKWAPETRRLAGEESTERSGANLEGEELISI